MAQKRNSSTDKKPSRKAATNRASLRGRFVLSAADSLASVNRSPALVAQTANHVPLTDEDIAAIDRICAAPPPVTADMRDAIERYRKIVS